MGFSLFYNSVLGNPKDSVGCVVSILHHHFVSCGSWLTSNSGLVGELRKYRSNRRFSTVAGAQVLARHDAGWGGEGLREWQPNGAVTSQSESQGTGVPSTGTCGYPDPSTQLGGECRKSRTPRVPAPLEEVYPL